MLLEESTMPLVRVDIGSVTPVAPGASLPTRFQVSPNSDWWSELPRSTGLCW